MKKIKFLSIAIAMLIAVSFANAQSSNKLINVNDQLIDPKVTFEVVAAKLKEGYTMEQLVKADKEMEDNFVVKQKGFLKREVAVSKDKTQLFVIVHWATLEDAEAAGAKFMTDTWAGKRMMMCDVVLFNHYVVGLAK